MKRSSKIWAKFMTVLSILCVLMCQVAVAENSNQFSVGETFAYTRLTLTLIITVLGGVLLCVGLSKNNKNQKK